MATIAKLPNGKYKAIIKQHGRILKTKTFIKKSAAKTWAKRLETDQEALIALDLPGSRITLKELVRDYKDWSSRLAWFDIYTHDTPAKGLFNKSQRTFSHGCIRVEKPKDLALALFIEQLDQWDENRLDEAIASEENIKVVLENSLPVYVVYLTSWVDDSGVIHFSRGHYLRDRSLGRELFLNTSLPLNVIPGIGTK